ITPGHPHASGLVERYVGTMKGMISKLAIDHPKQWFRSLPYVLWALRDLRNETTGQSPYTLVYGQLPKGPLSILTEAWAGERAFLLSLGKTAVEYLQEL
ncbi:MAG: hypothetical protein MUC29_11995, partial [Pyrinomonadaceae bacterium]|nr:hypothetical protein [Pyrinomonadaceae bacterium]